jgi:hypothetical protein
MAIAVVASAAADGTTGAIDTTGANLLVAIVNAETPAITDSKGNTWTSLTLQTSAADNKARLFYVANPTVGTGHTFSATLSYQTVGVIAFSGAHASSPFDQQNGSAAGSSPASPGSITPSENNCVVVAGYGFGKNANTFSVDGGFTIAQSNTSVDAVSYGVVISYLIQTTAAAANPAVTYTGSSGECNATIASFKVAAGGTASSDLSATAAATATATGASRVSVALDTDSAAVATAAGASRASSNLSTTGAAVGTLVGDDAGSAAETALSTAGAGTATAVGASRSASDLSSTGVAVGTLVGEAAGDTQETALSTAGAGTATATGAARASSDLDVDGAGTATAAGAARIASALSGTGVAVGTLVGSAVSGYATADMSSTGAGTGTLAGASRVSAALSAAGEAEGTLYTVEPTADQYLLWGANARRRRQEQAEEEEELLQMVAAMMPQIMKHRKGARL